MKAKDSFRKKELMAQILYRLEKFEQSFEAYRELIKNANDDFEQERQTNLSAIIACLQQQGVSNVIQSLFIPQLLQTIRFLCFSFHCYKIKIHLWFE